MLFTFAFTPNTLSVCSSFAAVSRRCACESPVLLLSGALSRSTVGNTYGFCWIAFSASFIAICSLTFSTSFASSSLSDLTFFFLFSATWGFTMASSAVWSDKSDFSSSSFCSPKSSGISGSTQPDIGICDTWLSSSAPKPSGFMPLICCKVFLPSSSALSPPAPPPKTGTGSDATPKSGSCTISPAFPEVRLVVFFSFIAGELG